MGCLELKKDGAEPEEGWGGQDLRLHKHPSAILHPIISLPRTPQQIPHRTRKDNEEIVMLNLTHTACSLIFGSLAGGSTPYDTGLARRFSFMLKLLAGY